MCIRDSIKTDLAPYDVWERDGLITVTGTQADYKNDYKYIIKQLSEIKEQYDINILGIGVDPHNADGVLADLEGFGCPVALVTQSARNLNDATDDIRLLVKSQKLESVSYTHLDVYKRQDRDSARDNADP